MNKKTLFPLVATVCVTGVAVASGYATYRFTEKGHFDYPEDKKKMAKDAALLYLPVVISGIGTIVALTKLYNKEVNKLEGFIDLYECTAKGLEAYKAIKEPGGKDDKGNKREVEIQVRDEDRVLFQDEMSGRYFYSTVQEVRNCVNAVNHKVNNFMYASLTDFYDELGLEPIPISEDLGWNVDKLLEVHFAPGLTEDTKPCVRLEYNSFPVTGFDRMI